MIDIMLSMFVRSRLF